MFAVVRPTSHPAKKDTGQRGVEILFMLNFTVDVMMAPLNLCFYLLYILLLIISCIIEYVTNKRTLNLVVLLFMKYYWRSVASENVLF